MYAFSNKKRGQFQNPPIPCQNNCVLLEHNLCILPYPTYNCLMLSVPYYRAPPPQCLEARDQFHRGQFFYGSGGRRYGFPHCLDTICAQMGLNTLMQPGSWWITTYLWTAVWVSQLHCFVWASQKKSLKEEDRGKKTLILSNSSKLKIHTLPKGKKTRILQKM